MLTGDWSGSLGLSAFTTEPQGDGHCLTMVENIAATVQADELDRVRASAVGAWKRRTTLSVGILRWDSFLNDLGHSNLAAPSHLHRLVGPSVRGANSAASALGKKTGDHCP